MSPVKKPRAKRGAKQSARRASGKPARTPGKRAAHGAAKKHPRKRAARRAARSAGRGAAKKSARRVPKRATKKAGRAARRSARTPKQAPALKLVKKPPAPKAPAAIKRPAGGPVAPAAEAFAGAKAGATTKELLLFELERARVSVHAAIQGLGEAAADQPIAPGKWSARQIVLHLAQWDREVTGWIEPVYARNLPYAFDWSKLSEHNARRLAEVSHVGWDDAKRLLRSARAEMLTVLESIPDDPAEVWTRGHALGKLLGFLPKHDRHHADQIKRARSASPAPPP